MPGLGKNSPIVLSQSKTNFEALIERHGQWVRWRTAKKCPCVTEHNRVNVHCEKCGGSGYIYGYQRGYEDTFRAVIRDNIIAVPEEHADSEIIIVYDSQGRKLQYCRCGDFIQITDAAVPDNEFIDVMVRVSTVKRLESVTLEKAGGGYYRVPGILTPPSAIDNVYYQEAGDVIAAEGLEDSDGGSVKVNAYRRDMIHADSDSETLTAASVEYIMPFRFIILSQNLSKEDAALVNAHNGEAVCTFPYIYSLSENDVITVLSGAMTHKVLIEKRGDNIDDTIPEFFVIKADSIETKTAAYKEGEDYILVGTNKLHWTGRQPGEGEAMSITYQYHPTYAVAKEIPMLRTSEDQRIPRKVALKLFAAFGEAKGVNRNG